MKHLPISELDEPDSKVKFVNLVFRVLKAVLCSSVSSCEVVSVEKMAKNDLRYWWMERVRQGVSLGVH